MIDGYKSPSWILEKVLGTKKGPYFAFIFFTNRLTKSRYTLLRLAVLLKAVILYLA